MDSSSGEVADISDDGRPQSVVPPVATSKGKTPRSKGKPKATTPRSAQSTTPAATPRTPGVISSTGAAPIDAGPLQSDVITLKIMLFKQGSGQEVTKALRFSNLSVVSEIMKEIVEKVGVGDDQFGVFLPPNKEKGTKGEWLNEDAILRNYSLAEGAVLHWKSKFRALSLRLIDDSKKKVIINESTTVREICLMIAKKLEIKSPDEFSLRKILPPELSKSPQWLIDEKTLHDQEVDPEEELEYAKRFFFSDDYVDKDDPFTLHLLYVGSNKSIIEGQYPVSPEQASELGGLQMQILFGNFKPSKEQEENFIDVNVFLPKRYRKEKKCLTDITKNHQNFSNLDVQKAKYRYVQTVRGLASYGTTYFDCTEEIKKTGGRRPKTRQISIGVTKEKIVIMNPKTQEVEEEFVWKQIARWSFKGTGFVFDFGDYRANYLEIQSAEALAMNTLISGYIDIILKELQTTARVVEAEVDDIAHVEEMAGDFGMAQQGATSTYTNPYLQGGLAGMLGGGNQQAWALPGGGMGGNPFSNGLAPSMNTNVVDMGSALKAAKMLSNELANQKGLWGNKGSASEQQWNAKFNQHNTQLMGGVQDMLGMVRQGEGKLNRQQLDVKSKDIVMNMMNMATAARALNAFTDENGPLLDGAKAVADSVADLMNLLMKNLDDPLGADALAAALEAADRMFLDAQLLCSDPHLAQYVDKGAELLMMMCIEDVDRNMAQLTDLVSRAAEELSPTQLRELEGDIAKVQAVKGLALTSLRQLVPIILDKRVPVKVEIARKTLSDLTNALSAHSQKMVPQAYHPQLQASAVRVDDSLANLLAASRTAELRAVADVDLSTPLNRLVAESVTLKNVIAHPTKRETALANIKNLDPQITAVVATLISIANPTTQEALKVSSKGVQDALAGLYLKASLLEEDPTSELAQKQVMAACDALVAQCQILEADSLPVTSLNDLRFNAKAVAASVMQLNTGATLALAKLDDSAVKHNLLAASLQVKEGFGNLLSSLQASVHDPLNLNKTVALVTVLKTQIPQHSQLSTDSKKASRLMTDLNERQELDLAAELVSKNIRSALVAANKVSNQSGLHSVEAALEDFDAVKAILDHNVLLLGPGLKPVPGQSREDAQALLAVGVQGLNKAMANLTNVSGKGPAGLEAPIRAAAVAMSQVVATLLPLAASTDDLAERQELLKATQKVYATTVDAVTASKEYAFIAAQGTKQSPNTLLAHQKNVTEATTVLTAKAQQLNDRDLDIALKGIEKAKQNLHRNLKVENMSYFEASQALSGLSAAVGAGTAHLSNVARFDTPMLAASGNVLAADTTQLLELCSLAASVAPSNEIANNILNAAKNLSDGMTVLFTSAKVASAAPTPENHAKLVATEKAILEALLPKMVASLGVSTSAESQQAHHKINTVLASLSQLDSVAAVPIDVRHEYINCTKEVSRAVGALVSSGRAGLPIENGIAATDAANAIRNLIGAAKCAQDSNGALAPMSLDGVRLCKGADLINENIEDPKKAMQIAKKVTQNAFNLINNAKQVAKADPNHRAEITRDSQAVVKSTTQLAEVAKIAAAKRSPLALQQLAKTSLQLKENVKQLEATLLVAKNVKVDKSIAVDPETAKLLMAATQKISLHTIDIIKASSTVAINPNDSQVGALLNKTTKDLTVSISGVMKVSNSISPSIAACEQAVIEIQKISAQLEDASAKALAKQLVVPGVANTTLLQAQRDTMNNVKVIASGIRSLLVATQENSENLQTSINAIVTELPAFYQNALLVAGNFSDPYEQGQLLALSKALTDSLASLIKVVPTVTPDESKSVTNLLQAGALTTEALGLLIQQLKEGSDVATGLKNASSTIKSGLDALNASLDTQFSYDECRADLIKAARDLSAIMSGLVSVDFKNQSAVLHHVTKLADTIPHFTTSAASLAGAASDDQTSAAILAAAKQVVNKNVEMTDLVQDLVVGKDQHKQLLSTFTEANASLSQLLALAKEGAVSERDILQAKSLNQVSINHVNKNHILAKTGLLDADKDLMNQMVSDLQKKSLKDIKALLNSATGFAGAIDHQNTEQISAAALDFSEKLSATCNDTILVACRMTNQQNQVDNLQFLKNIVTAGDNLTIAGFEVFQKPGEREVQKERANQLVAVLQREAAALVESIQVSSAEAVRGERELTAFKKAIKNLIENTKGSKATAQDVIVAARQVFEVTSELVFASDADAAVEAGRKSVPAIAALLDTSRGAAMLSPDPTVQDAVIESSVGVARGMVKLIELSKLSKADPATGPKLEAVSATINDSLNDLIAAVNRLPGGGNLHLHMQDLDFVAENQLKQTGEAIGVCSNALLASKKPPKPKKGGDDIDQTDINNALLDASAAIAQATGTLVNIGSTIQKGRTDAKKAKLATHAVKTDPTALKALIGASLETEKAIENLTGNAQSSIVKLQEQALADSAKNVTAATSHMVAALRAGSQPHEQGLTEKLTQANQAVAEATGQLLSATHRAAAFQEETEVIIVPSTGKVRELEIQVNILKLEKAIKKEKRRLEAMQAASTAK